MRKAGHQLLLIRTAICSSSAFTHQLQFNTRGTRPPLLPSTQYLRRHQSATTTTSLHCSTNNNNNEAISIMPNGVKKENLPTKVCVVCGRPYTWRYVLYIMKILFIAYEKCSYHVHNIYIRIISVPFPLIFHLLTSTIQ